MSNTNTDGINQYADLVRRLYLEEKMSDAEVAAALPIEATASGVYHFRIRNGIKGHRRGGKSSLDLHREEIIRLYTEDKLTDGQIASRYNVTAEAVRRARVRWDVVTDKNKSEGRFSREAQFIQVKDELPAAWERSKRFHKRQQRMVGSSARVGAEFGVGASTAAKWLARIGLGEVKSVYGDDAPKKAVDLFDGGLSVPAVARQMGVPEDTVRNWISKHRDLSNHHERRSHEEKIAFRQAVSDGRGGSVVGNGRFKYNDVRMDSSWEVRFAKNLDRLGVEWTAWDRERNGTVEIPGEVVGRYSPDFLVGDLPVEIKGVYDATAALKVSTWREERGRLAVVMRNELLELESARTAEEAIASLQAFCYLDPPARRDGWS